MAAFATKLISAPWVIPIASAPLREGAVALNDQGRVVAVGSRDELLETFGGLPEDRGEGALLPGLVNAHTHLELAHLTGAVPGGAGLVDWVGHLLAVAKPKSQEARDAAARAAKSAVDAGTAAVGDVGNGLGAVPGIAAAGLQGIFFHELVGSREARTGDALADAARERDEFTRAHGWPASLAYVPAPHAPYSVGAELFKRIFAAAAQTGRATTVHVAEGQGELALLLDGEGPWVEILESMGVPRGSRTPGLRPVPYLASLGAFDGPQPPLLVHMVLAAEEDLALARRHHAPVVLCPRSNQHVAGRLPDVPAMVREGLSLALGTDSLASAPDMSLWGEMQVLAKAFPRLPALTWLMAATVSGARALGLGALGGIAPGKRPGLIDVAIDDMTAPIEALVRNAAPRVRWMARA
jgi:cytosine/adenosine deaminase-related metal-dependent hydrolase